MSLTVDLYSKARISSLPACAKKITAPGLTLLTALWILLIILGGQTAFAAESSNDFSANSSPITVDRWQLLRSQLFGEREIMEDSVVELEAPGRAFEAARVPVTIRASAGLAKERFIRKLYLIVDNNPLPVAGTFTFEPNNGWDTIDTELRVNEYSYARAVAELNDGSLHMSSSFVKAVGGCSAPPSSFERSEASLLGNFKGGIDQILNPDIPAMARVRLVHPNASGMQFDQYTRTYIQPHYVHTIGADFNDKKLFTLETNFSLSQDPVLGFNFKPGEDGELKIYAIDSKDQRFEQSWKVESTNF